MTTYDVYGRKACGFCIEATRLLGRQDEAVVYTVVELLAQYDKERLQSVAGRPFMTVPQIFKRVDDELIYVGGYKELLEDFK